ncbi:MAG: TetM/TetW/TetO/TetS family tetracycline resistance ribosomal protection protein [Clostridiales Family XIII bacterium]|jgi:ribosomal protection tetracycline resistance protein|nr:TetM/TetW/TetO/TetS family tetracycline resistance ribosomal protection protein [Clostridiales Family XIII bacterium]
MDYLANQTKTSPIINFGILAHVDAGKTTVTEQLLYHMGAIRILGNVDQGTTHTDTLLIERTRKITVNAVSISADYDGKRLNIIDTPGHADFIAQVERSLAVLDCAVLVLSAVEGIQGQTLILWEALRRMGKPVLLFINKTDRAGADVDKLIHELKNRLSKNLLVFSHESQPLATSDDTYRLAFSQESNIEVIADSDDELMNLYLEENAINEDDVRAAFLRAFHQTHIFPVLCGSAIKDEGITELLNFICNFFPQAHSQTSVSTISQIHAQPYGIIYQISHDKQHGKIAHIRLYTGNLHPRDVIHNITQDTDEKVAMIRKNFAGKITAQDELRAGDIGMISGLASAQVGDYIGYDTCNTIDNDIIDNNINSNPRGKANLNINNSNKNPSAAIHAGNLHDDAMIPQLVHPLFMSAVLPESQADFPALSAALTELAEEDPYLSVQWSKETNEIVLHITGKIQTEILQATLKERFGLLATFASPTTIYKETIDRQTIGFESYTMPKPCWAVLKFEMNPLPRGTGVHYEANVNANQIAPRYLAQVKQTIPLALQQGPQGWEVTDIDIHLIDGQDHNEHTHPLDFVLATPLAIMNGLYNVGTILLEPYLSFELSVPAQLSSKVIGMMIAMRGEIENSHIEDDIYYANGKVSAAESTDFPTTLASLSSGKAFLATSFRNYENCPPGYGESTPYRGVNPLDRSKYILSMRGALSS